MNTAKLTIGDWSDDGHGKTDTVMIEIPDGLTSVKGKSTKTRGCSEKPDLSLYFALAVSSGVPDISKFCKHYEESTIPAEEAKALMALFGDDIFQDEVDEEEGVSINSEDYANIWVDIVNHGINLNGETGKVKIVPENETLNYNIGGYGLFWG